MCAFFARPNLDNTQFKQLPDSLLTLSGQTQIANVTGLTISDENGIFIPVIVTGATNYEVLTYTNGQITLQPVAGGGSGVYSGASPTTCTVGGLAANSPISGLPISDILESILAPTISPDLTPNSISLSLSPTASIFEAGCPITFTASAVYNQGSVSPVYCGGPAVRTGAATSYTFTNINGAPYIGVVNSCLMPSAVVVLGSQSVSAAASYSAGLAPLKSDGTPMGGVTCPSGTKSTSITVTGVLPYYWGKSTTTPITKTCVAAGNKVVACANGTLPIVFNSTSSDYLWLAVPQGTPAKTCWYVNGTNNGAISGIAGQTWAQACTVTGVTTTFGCVCPYSVYVTCLQTGTDAGVPMCFY